MGLFAAEDGQVRGWLAALLCCCAAVNEDELVKDHDSKASDSTRSAPSYQQPLPMKPLADYSSTTVTPISNGNDSNENDAWATHAPGNLAEQPPSLKPLSLGDSSLLERRARHGVQKSPTTKVNRLSIGAPSGFRKLDPTDGQRQSLIPLRLGPVVLKDTPIPDAPVATRERSESTQGLLADAHTTPCHADQLVSAAATTITSVHTPSNLKGYEEYSRSTPDLPMSPPPVSTQYPSYVPSRQDSGTSTSPVSHRSSSDRDRTRLKRKRSIQSSRKPSNEIIDSAVEKEIIELNTIVEERRAEAARGAHALRHVPAIAPSMQIGARSETLNAIGSALSRPLTAPEAVKNKNDSSNSDIDLPLQQPTSKALRRSRSSVSGWLSGMFSSASEPHLAPNEPFYKCQPPMPAARPRSRTSLCSFVSDSDSPSLSAASSPTTKGHSRTITADSRLTPITPPGMNRTNCQPDLNDSKPVYEEWPPARVSLAQVGVAM